MKKGGSRMSTERDADDMIHNDAIWSNNVSRDTDGINNADDDSHGGNTRVMNHDLRVYNSMKRKKRSLLQARTAFMRACMFVVQRFNQPRISGT